MVDRLTAGVACRHLRWLVLAACLSSCGDSPTNPDPPVPAPTLTCPADIQASARQGQPPVVAFDTPVAAGGSAPVTTTCAPASGTAFPLGTTRVTCTATDSRGRSGTCGFSVIVSAVPVLSSVRFLAFGDSITEGTTSPDPTTLVLSLTESYPYKLQSLLSGRYIDQSIVVLNRGKAGEAAYPDGMMRFPRELDGNQPQVALVLDGANDLLAAASTGMFNAAIARITTALEEMIRSARSRGVRVMLATFPPQNPNGSRGGGAEAVPRLNAAIANARGRRTRRARRPVRRARRHAAGSIGVDGLHPTDAGYTKIANIWFDAIKREYEASGALHTQGAVPRLVFDPARP